MDGWLRERMDKCLPITLFGMNELSPTTDYRPLSIKH